MKLAETAIGNLHIDKGKAFDFFAVYARYEYAAKACGHVQKSAQQIDLKIVPKSVADAIEKKFQAKLAASADLTKAVDYYRKYPPKKPVWDGAAPKWVDVPHTEKGSLLLLLHLAQVRNNLFHGGKGWKAEDGADRDNLLIEHGLILLGAIISSEETLEYEFSSFQ